MSSPFFYQLPDDKIALYPANERSESKLLIYKGDDIKSDVFSSIAHLLPCNSLLVRNSSKVIKARMFLHRETGSRMEVFCLSFQQTEKGMSRAECLIKNVKKLKTDEILSASVNEQSYTFTLKAQFTGRNEENSLVTFSWEPMDIDFYTILDMFGEAPLPPYIKREAEDSDAIRYQTIYADENGSVAAPTAGLHFTDVVEEQLIHRSIDTAHVVLHVGLGTFQPMKSGSYQQHTMHSERFSVSKETIEKLMQNESSNVVCVGTTSLRTIESLYIAAHFTGENSHPQNLHIGQWDANSISVFLPRNEAWNSLLQLMQRHDTDAVSGNTSFMITPDYRCRTTDYLITNFHQPESTLLLIVASFIGDKWKEVYDYALTNNFRFLSYGDACLFRNLNQQE